MRHRRSNRMKWDSIATRFAACTRCCQTISCLTHLPVVVDPSHATGRRSLVTPLARAAVAIGADGILVEVHAWPEKAYSDGAQSLAPAEFDGLMRNIAPYVRIWRESRLA